MNCALCRIDLASGQTHCPRCGLRIAPLARPAHRDHGRARHPGDLRRVAITGFIGASGIFLGCALIAVVVRDGAGYLRSFENAAGLIGGMTLVAAFVMGGVPAGSLRRGPDVHRRMARREPAAPGVRLIVAVAGAVPVGLAIALALTGH